MPRVSEAHLAARRQHILDAARVCFTRNGFHATSMQDVVAEAGVSVGAVYRYFKGKEEIVMAIADQFVGVITERLVEITEIDPPLPLLEALRRTLDTVEPQLQPGGAFRFAMQVWPESFRNPTLEALVRRIYGKMRGHFVELARRAVQSGELPPDADVEAVGSALFALIPGYGLQRVLLGAPDRATYLTGVATLIGAKMAG